MTADDRAPRSGQTFTPPALEPTTDEVPVGSASAPTTGQQPTRSSLRPTTGQQPVSGQSPVTPAPQSGSAAQPASGQQPTAPQRPFAPVSTTQPLQTRAEARTATPAATPAVPATAGSASAASSASAPAATSATDSTDASQGAEHSFAAVLGGGMGKLKEYGDKAKRSITEGNDMPAHPGKGAPRRARVLVSRVDPWSVLKIGFLLSIAIGIMTVVATYVIWHVLDGQGLFILANDWILQLFTEPQDINLMQFFELNKWMSAAILLAVVNVVLLTALSAIAAFLYNAVSSVVGGVYVTLTDD
ncbi:DUF3566 domain-containing protein [Demequina sp. NBRC 110055]|uniref:DUF3566 domain-containing protein n=1 Tax=Demequina sp. NBRC 110055 TaxID=1570344 RepID=UPI0009FF3986|nr:DUF3566 domain-containing protein [Demequina sp. NBRC 110055]